MTNAKHCMYARPWHPSCSRKILEKNYWWNPVFVQQLKSLAQGAHAYVFILFVHLFFGEKNKDQMHTSQRRELFERENAVTLDLHTIPAQFKENYTEHAYYKENKALKKIEIEVSWQSVKLLKCRYVLILKEFLQRLLQRIY